MRNRPICFGSLKVAVIGSLCNCEFWAECMKVYRESVNNDKDR